MLTVYSLCRMVYVRITFSSLKARSVAFSAGVSIYSASLRVSEAQLLIRIDYVYHLPYEVPDSDLTDGLSAFGVVHSVTEQTFPGSSIFNGSRIVKMSVTSDIPSRLPVLCYPCRLYCKGQLGRYFICNDPNHRAADCPLRDVCHRLR